MPAEKATCSGIASGLAKATCGGAGARQRGEAQPRPGCAPAACRSSRTSTATLCLGSRFSSTMQWLLMPGFWHLRGVGAGCRTGAKLEGQQAQGGAPDVRRTWCATAQPLPAPWSC
jgi:hypothetical protein